MADIIHRIGIKSPAAQVYKALSTIKGLSNWWTEEVEGDEKIGGKIKFTFRSDNGEVKGSMAMEVQELSPGKVVRWTCVAALSVADMHSRVVQRVATSRKLMAQTRNCIP